MKHFALYLFLLGLISCCSNKAFGVNFMFEDEILKNPVKYKDSFEKMFNYYEIGVFVPSGMINTAILENGYAKSAIVNPDAWEASISNRKVKRIDVIFTRYPLNKEDWITNYHELLADRLKALFKIDPSLNDAGIEWNLVLQADCQTAWDAKKFFHGILIVYEIVDPIQVMPSPIKEETSVEVEKENLVVPQKSVLIPDPVIENISVSDRPDETRVTGSKIKTEGKRRKKKSQKPERMDLPDCPTFDKRRR